MNRIWVLATIFLLPLFISGVSARQDSNDARPGSQRTVQVTIAKKMRVLTIQNDSLVPVSFAPASATLNICEEEKITIDPKASFYKNLIPRPGTKGGELYFILSTLDGAYRWLIVCQVAQSLFMPQANNEDVPICVNKLIEQTNKGLLHITFQ